MQNRWRRTSAAAHLLLGLGAFALLSPGVSAAPTLSLAQAPARATAARTIELIVSVAGPGTLEIEPKGPERATRQASETVHRFSEGTVVRLTAKPKEGARFRGWSDACGGSSPVCTIRMESDRKVLASFESESPRGALRLSGEAAPHRPIGSASAPPPPVGVPGSVPSPPGALQRITVKGFADSKGFGKVEYKSSQGTADLQPLSAFTEFVEKLPAGDVAKLSASVYDDNQKFVGWGGDCANAGSNPVCNLKADGPKTIFVRFEEIKPTAKVTVSGVAGSKGFGRVTLTSKAGIEDLSPVTGFSTFVSKGIVGDSIKCQAMSYDDGQKFVEWGGDCGFAGNNPVCVLSIDGPKSVIARFDPK